MAKKQAKTAIKSKDKNLDSKNFTRVIKALKSPKTGAYLFKDTIIHKDEVKNYLQK